MRMPAEAMVAADASGSAQSAMSKDKEHRGLCAPISLVWKCTAFLQQLAPAPEPRLNSTATAALRPTHPAPMALIVHTVPISTRSACAGGAMMFDGPVHRSCHARVALFHARVAL